MGGTEEGDGAGREGRLTGMGMHDRCGDVDQDEDYFEIDLDVDEDDIGINLDADVDYNLGIN